ncbi:MAG: TrkA family potassium uptake protein [Lentisphaerae bacterium]|nr:TrkA family potassium uptake protein [Lentisphaerota bacterium]
MKGAYAVFGAGSFGSKVATELSDAGHQVVVIDRDREAVMAIREKVTEALVADVSNPDVIRELDVKKFNAIIMGMSSHFEDLILALTLVKQEGAGKIYVKANSAIQKRILLRLGADMVIQPDQDVAERLCAQLSMSNIGDMFEFRGSFIAEVRIPARMVNKTIRELDLRNRYNLTILLVKKPGQEMTTVWDPNMVLQADDRLVVIGAEKAITEVFK